MAEKRDYYEVLGVPQDADPRTLKSAYRKLALKFHPDRNPGNSEAEERFKEAAEAYEILADERKRALYDRGGFDALKSGGFSPGFSGDVGDIFSQFSDIFAEFFGGGMGGFGSRGPRPTVGSDLGHDIEVSLEEVVTGVVRQVELNRRVPCVECGGTGAEDGVLVACEACGGRGQVVQGRGGFMIATTCRQCGGMGRIPRSPCRACDGEGQVAERKKLEVRVPPGVDNGVRLRLQGEGEAGMYGGPPGDLYVFVHLKPHDLFIRKDADLHCELGVGYPAMCLGGEAQVPKIDGESETIQIPPGSQPGDVIRVARAGLPVLGNRGQGDMHVHLTIVVPKRLTDPQQVAVNHLAEVLPIAAEVSADGPDRRETTRKRRKRGGLFERLRDAFDGDA